MSNQTSNNIIEKIVNLMQVAEKLKRFPGNRKKKFVLDSIKKDFPEIDNTAVIEMLSDMIDIFILLDKNKLHIKKGFSLLAMCC